MKSEPIYKILRFFYQSERLRTVRTGLTLAQATEHLDGTESHSRRCTGVEAKRRTKRWGPWSDSYTEEK